MTTAKPNGVSYDSQYSNFTFTAGPIELTARFFSPVIPKDYCRTSIPLSYLTVETLSTDGADHDVTLYSHVNGAWAAYESNATLTWDIYSGGQPVNASNPLTGIANVTASDTSVYNWIVGLDQQYLFGEESQFTQWGNFTFNTVQGAAIQLNYSSGHDIDLVCTKHGDMFIDLLLTSLVV